MLRPTGDNIIVEAEDMEENISPGGILVHEVVKERDRGLVLAVGSGMLTLNGERIPCEVKEGDRVIFNPLGAREVMVGGKDVIILKEASVQAIL